TKPSIVRIRQNGVLVGASYTDVDATNSVVESSSAGTAIAGGDVQFVFGMAKSDSLPLELSTATYFLNPGDFFTMSLQATNGTVDGVASFNWEELF
ncbi:unnamed protein product, partial [marine sediment metagenome]